MVSWNGKIHFSAGSFFFGWLSLGLDVWPRLDGPFVSQNSKFMSHFLGWILGCAYNICSYGQIIIESFSHQLTRWFSTGVWVTANLLKSPGLFSVLWLISTMLYFGQSPPLPCINPLVTVPRASITIGKIINFMFHSFFNFLARSRYLPLFSDSFNFTLWSAGTAKSTILQVLSFLLIVIRSGYLAEIRWSICISNSPRSWHISFSRIDSGLCIYHLFVWSNFNFLHNSQWIALPTQSCLVLYIFCANLLYSLIMWLMVSSLSPHNLHVQFCCVLSILTLV